MRTASRVVARSSTFSAAALHGVHQGGAVLIRRADDDDWPSIYPIFARIVAEGETYAFPEGMRPEEARPWWMEEPPGQTVVAVDGHDILGTAKMGLNRPGRGAHVATASFMVAPEHRGRGVGRALGRYVLDWAGAAGYLAMQFIAVVETNRAAVSLWSALGFEVLATVPEAFDHPRHGLVGLHLMHRRLEPPEAAPDEGPDRTPERQGGSRR
ncbi:MAG TPA: GNAT family N-acetyltransferase [Actinomycetes bacterium]|nr:GNAT family N-acetyltransferase [Actinomycetes bacterium]